MKKLLKTKKFQIGFTLIELLIVVTIIVILISIGAVSYTTVNRNARNSQRQSDLQKIATALEEFKADHGAYPNTVGCGGVVPVCMEAAGRGCAHAPPSGTSGGDDHICCLLGNNYNTLFVRDTKMADCGVLQPGTSTILPNSNLPANVYLANGDLSKIPVDPLDKSKYAYGSDGKKYILLTSNYEGLPPVKNRFTSSDYFWTSALYWYDNPAFWLNQYALHSLGE